MSNYVCNECTSDDIEIIKDKSNEMDCYCNNCKQENYTVSLWWTNKQENEEEKRINTFIKTFFSIKEYRR